MVARQPVDQGMLAQCLIKAGLSHHERLQAVDFSQFDVNHFSSLKRRLKVAGCAQEVKKQLHLSSRLSYFNCSWPGNYCNRILLISCEYDKMINMIKTLVSWNVNGVRAAVRKGFLEWLQKTKPDILGIQETKAQVEQLDEAILHPPGYQTFWSSANKKGYSGTAVFVRQAPQMSITNFQQDWLDEEGRVILLEYPDFLFFNVYFPNGGQGPVRLKYKLDFYDKFTKYIEGYRQKGKSIIICGDYNTAHHPIDLARPQPNIKNSGFMPIERKRLDKLESLGYIDTFRDQHPQQVDAYSYWDMKSRARDRNVGWRIDYFWVSQDLQSKIKDAFIWPDIMGSDHCPVGIKIDTLDR